MGNSGDTDYRQIEVEARSRHSSSVGCVSWSVAYAPVVVVAVVWQPRHYSLQAIERTKQGNHGHNAATARLDEVFVCMVGRTCLANGEFNRFFSICTCYFGIAIFM